MVGSEKRLPLSPVWIRWTGAFERSDEDDTELAPFLQPTPAGGRRRVSPPSICFNATGLIHGTMESGFEMRPSGPECRDLIGKLLNASRWCGAEVWERGGSSQVSSSDRSSNMSSLPPSVIQRTRDEPRHISSPPVNANKTPELITEAEDYTQDNSSSNVYDDGHAVAGPSHFICDACDECFFFKSQIDRHYVIHSGEKSFSCQICEQKFSVKWNLRRHMLTHSEQKAHECDGCHKVCTQKANLVRYYRNHTGEKCGKRFSDPSHFNKQRKSSGSSSEAD
ncbi:Zinc finger protein 333 [Araneus ventricosus]|uniref:Zinc finger protein 333 n=1 Tax=Araneus ventricosus TaxID=182803 RepID=A0A4Y2FDE4_ARAVE|nr:Zinc finger protein 333 [Araneus ventricosus]